MNERIQELMQEAGYHFDPVSGYPIVTYSASPEKLAELIVRECAQLVQGVPTDTMGYHTADQKIKEHFGVE